MAHTRPDTPPVRIETDTEWAWCGERRLELTPRVFAVLRHLVERPQQLVTKDDLLAAVWGEAIVSDAALASAVRDLRKVLRDSARGPRYIETVHRRGFRFIGPVVEPGPRQPAQALASPLPRAEISRTPVVSPTPATLVGRDAELTRLHRRLEAALIGQRQLVFVTGEPGIGKTAVVEAFLSGIGGGKSLRVGRGQCVEQYGAGEAYLPVLEALGRLGHDADGGGALVDVLTQHAPTWLAQLPGLLADSDLEAVQRRAQGATRDRMLRELVEALDAVTVDAPLVLLLEDLHWSDSATIDLLAMLARRREAARLLILGTYRPADVAGAAHPLRRAKQELQVHGHCDEVPLAFLSVEEVGEYLAQRFPARHLPSELAQALHRSTDGNPLFLVNTVDYLIAREALRQVDGRWELSGPPDAITLGVPRTLWQMVEAQVERLTADEQAVLATASVAGVEFSAATAGAAGIDAQEGEQRCEALARTGQFIRAAGVAEWPDGTVAGRYAFIHALYQQVLYASVPAVERAGLHLRTGERLERGYGQRAGDIAGELAMHFEHGRDLERAVRYRSQAGEIALRRHAYREAAEHATRALDLLRASPDSLGRARRELALRVMLGAVLTATHGYAAPEIAESYARARQLCTEVGDAALLFPVLLGLGRFYIVRGDFPTARDVATQLMTMADASQDPALRLAAHNTLGTMSFYAGEFEAALAHLERGIELYDPDRHSPNRSLAFRLGQDPGVSCTTHSALALWVLGHPDRAAARMREAFALARSLDHPFSVSYVRHFGAGLHQWRRERQIVQELEETALGDDTEHGFGLFLSAGAIQRGWLLAERGQTDEGLAQMREAIARHREIGAEVLVPAFLALAAELQERLGRVDECRSTLAEAFTVGQRSGQHYWEAELHRLKGTLALRSDATGEAEASFLQALDVARRQRARSLELRAARSLARLWGSQGKTEDAHAVLAEVYGWFTEGFDTADLAEARALLEDLERGGAERERGMDGERSRAEGSR